MKKLSFSRHGSFFLFFILFAVFFKTSVAQKTKSISTPCTPSEITDQRDLTENISGQTMGQKLESLLFWSQEEKERRFPMMQSIFPSIPVVAGNTPFKFKKGKTIHPIWKDGTTLDSYIKDNHIGGVVVLQNNKIRLEAYGKGVHQHTLWTSYSVAKSVASVLVGVALKEGYIKNLDDKLENYIPEFQNYDYGKVTIRQLLTMTSGIAWNEDYTDHNSDVAQMYLKDCEGKEAHILSYMKRLKAIAPPGSRWNYSTGETDLVGILIQKATGKSLATYLSEKIWKPYGMQDCAYWLADECSGLNIGGSGLSASLRDFALLGNFMLQNGKIGKQQILAREWLLEANKILIKSKDNAGGYGYLWWVNPDGSYMAQGIFGQMIYINPKKNIIIAQTAAWPQAGSKALSKTRNEFIKAVLKSL
ncbi:MAG TPA: serine hydrolase [Edaphocola sp.]|nr:serine hydrolase [Edaphocola sp.]